MVAKVKDMVAEGLAIFAIFMTVMLSVTIPLQGCAEADASQHKDTDASIGNEVADRNTPRSERTLGAHDIHLRNNEIIRESTREIPRAEIDTLVEPYGASVAVRVVSLEGQESLDINGDQSFVSASMIKLLVLACLLDKVEDGSLSLEQTYELNSADIVGGTGQISALPLGTVLSYDELAESMIAYSDNTAANVLIDALGMNEINVTAKKYGLAQTKLQRKMMDFDGTAENYMSANDVVKLLVGFANARIGNPTLSAKAIGYLNAQTDNSALAQGVPEGIPFAHKTGSLNEFRHDGGIVYADKPYAIVVFTSAGTAGDGLMSSVSAAAYAALEG